VRLDQEVNLAPKENVDSKDQGEPPVKTLYAKDPQDRKENPEKPEHLVLLDSKVTKVQLERRVTKVYPVSMALMELEVTVVHQVKLETQVSMVAMDRRETQELDDKVLKEIVDQQGLMDQQVLEDPLDFKD